jgi:diguanylate cyclase (GGDEF)-like protein/PAS domain S-box-containing protein
MSHTDFNTELSWIKQVFDSSPDPSWIIDGNKFLECNDAAARTLGYASRTELVNIHPSELSPPWQPDGEDSFAKAERMMAIARDKGFHRFEWIHTKADGSNFLAEVTLSTIELKDRKVMYCVSRDIAERKRADKALRESEKHIRVLFNSGNDPIFVYEADSISGAPLGHFVEVNDVACVRLGHSREELLRMRPEDIIAPEAAAHPAPGVKLAFSREATYESFHLTKGGSVIPVEINAHLFELYDKALVFAMARDIGERKQSEAALRESETRFRLTFELAGSGIAHVSLDGYFLRVNRSMCAILGYSDRELVGRTVKELSHPEDRDLTDAARARVLSGELESTRIQKRYLRKDGAIVWVYVTVALVRDIEGKPLYEIAVFDDTTERKQAEQALRDSAEKLRLFTDNVPAMTSAFDESLRLVFVNKRYAEFFGFGATDILGKHLRDIVGARAYSDIEGHFMQVLQGHPVIYQSSRRPANGEPRHLEIKLLPHIGEEGRVLGCFAVATDITEHKLAEQALRANEAELRLLTDNVPAMILYVDRKIRCVFANKRYADFFGFAVADLAGKPLREIIGNAAYPVLEGHFNKMLEGHPVAYQRNVQLKSGEHRCIEVKLVPRMAEQGQVAGCFAMVIDITEQKQAEERIQHVAHHDSLTGLPNRLLFNDRLGQAISLAKRDSRQLALLYLDLDKFKPVNDTLGHTVGDELLQAVAARLQHQVRESDTVARVGGDEFTIILPDIASLEQAETVAKKIVVALAAPFQLGIQKQLVNIGISIGIAVYPRDARDADALIKAADAAMYSAKQIGSCFRFCGT